MILPPLGWRSSCTPAADNADQARMMRVSDPDVHEELAATYARAARILNAS